MKSEIDIIIETAKYYNSSNIAVSGTGACTYMNDDGDMCAVGRCLSEEGMKIFKEFEDKNKFFDTSIQFFIYNRSWSDFENALKEEYRGHDIDFWQKLQQLHDTTRFWDGNGITEYGLQKIDDLFGHNAHTAVKEALAK